MQTTVKIDRWVNFYHFVQNLSEWHFSAVPEYNRGWQAEFGTLSQAETEALKRFAQIHKTHTFGSDSPLFSFFLTESDPIEKITQSLSGQEAGIISDCFKILNEKFDILWQKNQKKLEKWTKVLADKFSTTQPKNPEILATLSRLYKKEDQSFKNVTIFPVLSSTTNYLNASAYPNEASVIFPVSQVSIDKQNDILAIVWHELIHIYFDHIWLIPNLQKRYKEKDMQKINEITAATLFPSGVLGQKYFNQSGGANLYDRYITKEQGQQAVELMTEYVNENKPLDEKYIKHISHILEI